MSVFVFITFSVFVLSFEFTFLYRSLIWYLYAKQVRLTVIYSTFVLVEFRL